jgi:pre-mRNA-processing factor 17
MASTIAYSSDEEDTVSRNDAFGLSLLPVTKKPRVEDQAAKSEKTLDSAPHVLAEVRISFISGIAFGAK